MKDLQPEINLIKVPVTDFSRARAFYRDTLGLEEEFAVDEYGWAQYQAGTLPICIYEVGKGGGDGEPGNEVNFHLAVNDLAAAAQMLESNGVKLVCPLTSSDDGGSFLIIADPDGNRMKIVQRM